ncbi:hypothetical protein ACFQZE_17955 [Paenibacillus sp. GCM10027627]|uniref:hypothetical protein n=1 Tax=unclassified Paenibacillus TaxID=185978 RepID=UPI0036335286
MTHHSAIMFEFLDNRSTDLARDMLQELGYDPVMHNDNLLHIHVDRNDLTSALEIAQSHGGRLIEQSQIAEEAITNSAYALQAITIPAHVVNEDWIDKEERQEQQVLNNDTVEAAEGERWIPGQEEYNHFSGDVHI